MTLMSQYDMITGPVFGASYMKTAGYKRKMAYMPYTNLMTNMFFISKLNEIIIKGKMKYYGVSIYKWGDEKNIQVMKIYIVMRLFYFLTTCHIIIYLL